MSFRLFFLVVLSFVFVIACSTTSGTTSSSGNPTSDPADNSGGDNSGGGVASCPDYSSYSVTLTSTNNDDGFNPGGVIPDDFGYNQSIRGGGDADFPKLTWTASSNPTNFLLVLQDDDYPVWKHGIWLVDPATREVAKVDGGGANRLTMTINHANMAASNVNVTALENYYTPSSPTDRHRYRFRLYALNIEESTIRTALAGVISPKTTNPNESNSPNRITAIDTALATIGVNPENASGGCTAILETSEIIGNYP